MKKVLLISVFILVNLLYIFADFVAMEKITEKEFNEKYHILDRVKTMLLEEICIDDFMKQEEIKLEIEFYECNLFGDFDNIIHIYAKEESLFGNSYYYMILFFEKGESRKLLTYSFYVLNETIPETLPFKLIERPDIEFIEKDSKESGLRWSDNADDRRYEDETYIYFLVFYKCN